MPSKLMPIWHYDSSMTTSLEEYNLEKSDKDKIPGVSRSRETGWPMILVDVYCPMSSEGEPQWKHIKLPGGEHNDMKPAVWSFLDLLMDLPYQCNSPELTKAAQEASLTYNITITTPSIYLLRNRTDSLSSFTFSIKELNIQFKHSDQGFGATIAFPKFSDFNEPQLELLKRLLIDARQLAYTSKVVSRRRRRYFSTQEIIHAINTDIASFDGRGIYMDLGKLIPQKLSDESIKFFEAIFKVKEFLQLKINPSQKTLPLTKRPLTSHDKFIGDSFIVLKNYLKTHGIILTGEEISLKDLKRRLPTASKLSFLYGNTPQNKDLIQIGESIFKTVFTPDDLLQIIRHMQACNENTPLLEVSQTEYNTICMNKPHQGSRR